MKLLLLADLHLGARLLAWGEHADARRRALLDVWEQAVCAALDGHEIDAVLVAGDLFDCPDPSAEALDAVVDGLSRLHAANVPVVLLPGNYDGLYVPRSVYQNHTFPKNVTVVTSVEPTTVTIAVGDASLEIQGRINTPGADAGWLAESEPISAAAVRVGLWHARLPGAHAPGGWLPSELAAAHLANSGLHLAVIGGGHEFAHTLLGSVPTICPGAPAGLRSGEWGERHFSVAVIEDDAVSLETIPVRVAPIIGVTVDLAGEKIAAPGDLARHLKSRYSDAGMVTLRLTGAVSPDWSKRELAAELAKLPFAVDVSDESTVDVNHPSMAALRDETSVRGNFTRSLAEQLTAVGLDAPERHVFSRSLIEGLGAYESIGGERVD